MGWGRAPARGIRTIESADAEADGQVGDAQVFVLPPCAPRFGGVARAVLASAVGDRGFASGVEGEQLVQLESDRHGTGQRLWIPMRLRGKVEERTHGQSPEIRTCWASPNRSVPDTTTRSPTFNPSRISTEFRLLTPARMGRRTARSPSIT